MKPITSFIDQIIHGDCISVMRTMPEESVDLVVTDPPYLVNYRSRDGRGYPNDNNRLWLKPAFRELYRVLKPDRFCISFYGWPHVERFMYAWKDVGFYPVSHFVWVKRYRSKIGFTEARHEEAFLLAKGNPQKPARPPPDVLEWGSYTRNLLHPTQKPVATLIPLIKAYSSPGDIVLDPFAGSGTTGVAARSYGRHFILIELVASYYQLTRDRLAR